MTIGRIANPLAEQPNRRNIPSFFFSRYFFFFLFYSYCIQRTIYIRGRNTHLSVPYTLSVAVFRGEGGLYTNYYLIFLLLLLLFFRLNSILNPFDVCSKLPLHFILNVYAHSIAYYAKCVVLRNNFSPWSTFFFFWQSYTAA